MQLGAAALKDASGSVFKPEGVCNRAHYKLICEISILKSRD
jgi:hypothetical protein